jgi:hypothetical protein
MTSTVRFNVDRLIEIPAEHIAVTEILKGTFDDEIKRITTLRDELKARQDVDQTLEKATAALADAEAKQAAAKKELADANDQAQTMLAQARDAVTQAMQTNADADAKAAKTETARSIFEAEKANAQELMDQRSAALDLRESQLAGMAAKVGEDQRQLAMDREAFNKKLEALKV